MSNEMLKSIRGQLAAFSVIRLSRMPPELQLLTEYIGAGFRLDDIEAEYAERIHGDRVGPPSAADFSRARVRLMKDITRLRQCLDFASEV